VDDERSIADSLAFMRAHEGYVAKAAYSGTEAIEAAKDFRPNILITESRNARHFGNRCRRPNL